MKFSFFISLLGACAAWANQLPLSATSGKCLSSSDEIRADNYHICCPSRDFTDEETVRGVKFHYTCASWVKPYDSNAYSANSARECAQLCAISSNCVAASWFSSMGECYFTSSQIYTQYGPTTGILLLEKTRDSPPDEPEEPDCPTDQWWCHMRYRCIPKTNQCTGRCPMDRRAVGGQCILNICSNPLSGLQWDAYHMSMGNGVGQIPYTDSMPFLQQINIDYLFGGTPVQSANGTIGSIGWSNGVAFITGQRLQPFPQDYLLMSWTGYLVPKHTGNYTFNMWWTDDVSYLWVGEKARSEFLESNADLKVDYANLDIFGKKRFSYPAEQGKPIPIRAINVQSGGPYSLCFSVTDPMNQVVMNTCGEGGAIRESDGQIAYCQDLEFGSVFRDFPVRRDFWPDMPSSQCTNLKSGSQWNLYKFQRGSGPGHIAYTNAAWAPLVPAHSVNMVLAAKPTAEFTGEVDKIGWDSGTVLGLGPIYPTADKGAKEYFLMFWTSYLAPRQEGMYRFDMWWTDDVAFLWVGDDAISNFSETNADLKVDYASPFGEKRFEYLVTAKDIGKRIPIRVANVQSAGPFSVFMMVRDPSGGVVMNSGNGGSGKQPQGSNGEIGYCT
ncbi:hypothetical protein O988_02827 [Pseudogymnoascus sp. VKM F-3808]|nr:hypothetical protein O988_02827 [Pseudogymnoascus sp. VKM F-3808]